VNIGAGSAVTNYGTITASFDELNPLDGSEAVNLGGGSLINGSATDTRALIDGLYGVFVLSAAGTVTNFGTITANGGGRQPIGVGVEFRDGGAVTNGTAVDTAALIDGGAGVYITGGGGAVANFGTVVSNQAARWGGDVALYGGGSVANGSANDRIALVEGYDTGVLVKNAAGTVTNFAIIEGMGAVYGDAGVSLTDGGQAVNGSATDHAALIEGADGVLVAGAAGGVSNLATIVGTGGDGYYGVRLKAGGSLDNGAINDTAALISGYAGARLGDGASGVNFGVIRGTGGTGAPGVELAGAGAVLTNGAATDRVATIEGYFGVVAYGAATFTNFGTVSGADGVAVEFGSSTGTLAVEAGSVFEGAILGGGATLDLASGKGSLSGLFAAAGAVVSGSMTATVFQNFDTVETAADATFTDTAASTTLTAGDKIIDKGVLTVSGALVNAGTVETAAAGVMTIVGAMANKGKLIATGGTLSVEGAVTGTGSGQVNSGTLALIGAAFTQNVAFVGAGGTLVLAHGKTYAGTISGFSLTGATKLDLEDIAFTAGTTKAAYSGTATAGVLTVISGTEVAKIRLTGDYLASTWTLTSDGHGGTDIVDPAKPAPAASGPPRDGPNLPTHTFIQTAAGFGAPPGGSVVAGDDIRHTALGILARPGAAMA
jgi:hypothetical protein